MTPATNEAHPATQASFLALLAGILLFVSPWIYGADGPAFAWNNWIAGVLICLFALLRLQHPAATKWAWCNSILGLWTCFSPWVYRFAGPPGARINSLCVGLFIFCVAIIAAKSQKMNHDLTSTST